MPPKSTSPKAKSHRGLAPSDPAPPVDEGAVAGNDELNVDEAGEEVDARSPDSYGIADFVEHTPVVATKKTKSTASSVTGKTGTSSSSSETSTTKGSGGLRGGATDRDGATSSSSSAASVRAEVDGLMDENREQIPVDALEKYMSPTELQEQLSEKLVLSLNCDSHPMITSETENEKMTDTVPRFEMPRDSKGREHKVTILTKDTIGRLAAAMISKRKECTKCYLYAYEGMGTMCSHISSDHEGSMKQLGYGVMCLHHNLIMHSYLKGTHNLGDKCNLVIVRVHKDDDETTLASYTEAEIDILAHIESQIQEGAHGLRQSKGSGAAKKKENVTMGSMKEEKNVEMETVIDSDVSILDEVD